MCVDSFIRAYTRQVPNADFGDHPVYIRGQFLRPQQENLLYGYVELVGRKVRVSAVVVRQADNYMRLGLGVVLLLVKSVAV